MVGEERSPGLGRRGPALRHRAEDGPLRPLRQGHRGVIVSNESLESCGGRTGEPERIAAFDRLLRIARRLALRLVVSGKRFEVGREDHRTDRSGLGFHSRARRSASAICSGLIFAARASRFPTELV